MTRAIPWLLGVCLAALAVAPALAGERFDTVVIDAGHGGDDAGARGAGGTVEKDLVLAVAKDLARRLEAAGLTVVQTRTDDVFVPLEERTHIANDARGDLFLSIHANASTDHSVHGTETYFLALDASDASAASVASRENSAFDDAASGIAAIDDPFIALIGDMIATEHMQESNDVARLIQTELGRTPLKSRGVKQALFVVLAGVQMPAALVEIGFVTSSRDEGKLAKAKGRSEVASALERAVLDFGRRYDARRGNPGDEPGPADQR
ncbi:MAG: N-acetylmuramoyl-L-alanine amidase family protein [Myxococcota bacterium]